MLKKVILILSVLSLLVSGGVLAEKSKKDSKSRKHSNKSAKAVLIVKESEWKPEKFELHIKGKARGTGPVQILNAADESLIAEVTPKEKHFDLRQIITRPGVPCEIIVRQGTNSASSVVEDAPADCGRGLTIAGRVVDDPIPFAIVQFTINGQTFSTVADADGFYQIDVVTQVTDTLVTATATVPGGSNLELTSILGPVSALLEDANANGVVDSTGDFSTNITNVTTANVGLLVQANGGAPITSLAELQQAEKFVDASELLNLAAAIKLIVDDPAFSLPAGFDNLLAFASDGAAVANFIASVDPGVFDATTTAILGDAGVLPGFDATSIPPRYYSIVTAAPGFLSRSGSALDFDPAGTGVQYTADVDGRPVTRPYNWAVNSGILNLTFTGNEERISFPAPEQTGATAQEIAEINCCAQNTLIEYTVELDQDIVLLQNGSLEDKVSIASRFRKTYDPINIDLDGDNITDKVIQIAEVFEIGTIQASLRDVSQIQPILFDASLPVVGAWAMDFFYDLGDSGFSGNIGEGLAVDLLTFFANGSGMAKISGKPFSWSEASGVLSIEYSDNAGDIIRQDIRLLDTLDGVFGTFSEFTNLVTGVRTGLYNLSVRQDPTFAWSIPLLQTAPGSFWNTDVLNAWIKDQYDVDGNLLFFNHFGWQFDNALGDNALTNLTFFVGGGGNTLLTRDMSWNIEANGDLRIEGGYFGYCVYTLAIRCHTRDWTPLLQSPSSGRIWYIEEAKSDFSGTVPPVTRHGVPRINGIIETPIPPSDATLHLPLP